MFISKQEHQNKLFNVPIAVFFFNRPSSLVAVLKKIAEINPSEIYLICDGARPGKVNENYLVEECRNIAASFKWPGKVSVAYSETNLGCKNRLQTGLDWLFTNVDEAIIIEDDCVPAKAFFYYCEAMLNMYRNDAKVMSISGTCFNSKDQPAHYFSNYALMWGWATWADRWALYDANALDYKSVIFKQWWSRPICYLYWLKVLKNVVKGGVDTWDYQWILSIWRNKGFVCRPTVNLVKNIGFNNDATHTKNKNSPMADMNVSENADCSKKLGGKEIDRLRDRRDEIVWASINIRSLVYLYFPLINHLRRKKR